MSGLLRSLVHSLNLSKMSFSAKRFLVPLLVLSVETGVLGTPIYEGSLEPHKVRDSQNANAVLSVVASKLVFSLLALQ